MPGHNSLAQGFERRFLFGYGRHFWNAVGVVGFSMMATGGIFLLDAQFKESEFQVAEYFPEWMCSDDYIEYHAYKGLKQETDVVGGYPPLVVGECYAWKEWWYSVDNPRRVNKEGLRLYKDDFQQIATIWEEDESQSYAFVPTSKLKEITEYGKQLHIKAKKESSDAKFSNALKVTRAISSPFLASSGLGLVAFSSLLSAVLSIERNTRKD